MMKVLNDDNLLALLVGCRADVHHGAGLLSLLLNCGYSTGAGLDRHKTDQLAVRRHDDLVGRGVDKLAVGCLEMTITEILRKEIWLYFISKMQKLIKAAVLEISFRQIDIKTNINQIIYLP